MCETFVTRSFNTLKTQKKPFQNIDYFFTQRSLTEEHEYIDKHMVRKTKKVKVKALFNNKINKVSSNMPQPYIKKRNHYH